MKSLSISQMSLTPILSRYATIFLVLGIFSFGFYWSGSSFFGFGSLAKLLTSSRYMMFMVFVTAIAAWFSFYTTFLWGKKENILTTFIFIFICWIVSYIFYGLLMVILPLTNNMLIQETTAPAFYFFDVISRAGDFYGYILHVVCFLITYYGYSLAMVYMDSSKAIIRPNTPGEKTRRTYLKYIDFNAYEYRVVILSGLFILIALIYTLTESRQIGATYIEMKLNMLFHSNTTQLCKNLDSNVEIAFSQVTSNNSPFYVLTRHKDDSGNYVYVRTTCQPS